MENSNSTNESKNRTVFIDTSLDTHLALVISDNDTVLQVKEKIRTEHLNCFPMHGKIDVNAVKVEHKKCQYHLSDSMVVKSVLGGINGPWFLCVDAVPQVVSTENPLLLLNKDDIVPEKSLGDKHHIKTAGLAVKQVESLVSEKGKKKKVDLKRKLPEASLGTEAKDVVNTRKKKKMSNKTSVSENGLSSSGAGKDDITKDVVHETPKGDDADHPSIETQKAGKSLPPAAKSKAKTTVTPPCLEKGSDEDCGFGDKSVNMESLKTTQSGSKNPPKEQKVVISRDLNTSTDENRKQKRTLLKDVKKARTRKATSDKKSSKNVPEDGKAGGVATKGVDDGRNEDSKSEGSVEGDGINFIDYFLPKGHTAV